MKLKLFTLTITVVIAFTSCNKLKDLVSAEVDTNVNASASVFDNAKTTLSVPLKSSALTQDNHNGDTLYLFKGEVMINLRDNEDVSPYIDGIIDYSVQGSTIQVNGAIGTDSIYSLKVQINQDKTASNQTHLIGGFRTASIGGLSFQNLVNLNNPSGNDLFEKLKLHPTNEYPAITANLTEVPINESGINQFIIDWRDSDFPVVYLTIEGSANFSVDNKIKVELNMPSKFSYTPL